MSLRYAPAILSEVAVALRNYVETGETRTIYMSQLPLTKEDAQFVQDFLGHGRMLIQSNSPDITIWRESATPGVWWGEYHVTPQHVQLRTIEITEVPELACAQMEDVMDGLPTFEGRVSKVVSSQ